jgi:hypothetical protein
MTLILFSTAIVESLGQACVGPIDLHGKRWCRIDPLMEM